MVFFEDKYKALKSLGYGTSSHGYLVENAQKEKFVIKTPAMENVEDWMQECKKEISVLEPLHQLENRSYTLPLSVLEKGETGEPYMLSTLVQGESLSVKTYKNLGKKEKDEIAQSLAQFMSDLHEIVLPCSDKRGTNLEKFFHDKNLKKQIYKIFQNLPENICDTMNEIFSEFESDKNLFKYETMCHNDLVIGNLLYDKGAKKLGVIDFGDTSQSEIYADFGNLMRLGQLPDEFGIGVIEHYNLLQKEKKDPVQINIHSAKRYALVRSFKALKKLNKMSDVEKKVEILKFNNYLKIYKKNMVDGKYLQQANAFFSKHKVLQK